MPPNACFVDGRSVPLAEAAAAAAGLIAASRLPLLLVGACDVAGARAAIRLAERVGGVVDHAESAITFRELDVMRSFGKFIVTPTEARQRADTVLIVGSGLTKIWPEMPQLLELADVPRLALEPKKRQLSWIGAGDAESFGADVDDTLRTGSEMLPGLLAALRACVATRRVAVPTAEHAKLRAIAEKLRRAQFGLVVYSPSALDALAIEMLVGLVADLNKATRFSTISVGGGNAETLTQTAGWMTGFPARTGFARRYPEHDPWRFDARRLVETGEADALIWIASAPADIPAWASRLPVVALSPADTSLQAAKIRIRVGQHGHDHDAIDFARESQSLAFRRASERSDAPTAAAVLDEIAASLLREAA